MDIGYKEQLKHKFIKAPQDQMFYQILAHAMAISGLGAYNWKWYKYPMKLKPTFYKMHTRFVFAFVGTYFFMMFLFLFTSFSKLSKTALGAVYSILPIAFLVNVKVFSAQFDSYRKVLRDYMEKIHLYNYYIKNKSEYCKKIILQVEWYTKLIGITLFISMSLTWITWTITPILYNQTKYDSIINGTDIFLTCAYIYLPFEYLNDYNNWLIVNTISICATFSGSILICTFEILNYIIVFNLIGHIYVMKDNIKNRFSNKNEWEIRNNLRDLINHHVFVIKTCRDVEAVFGLNVIGNYTQNLLEGGILMYHFMLGEKESMLTYGVMIVIYMGGLLILSLVLEGIRIAAEDLAEALYCTPWEQMSVSNQKILLIILLKVQVPLQFIAAGGFRPGILPALSIIKKTFSCYVIIKSSI